MSKQFVARSLSTDWAVAPAQWELAEYDEPKIRYRDYVQEFLSPLSPKSIAKKTFITISTNVLCADKETSKEDLFPVDRDLYLPLEIVLTKWSLTAAKTSKEERQLDSKVWMVNPGRAVRGCLSFAKDHALKHAIDFDPDDNETNVYTVKDLNEVMKGINAFLTPDRLVFSLGIKMIRQDLGSLKWLNKQTGQKCKPIRVYSLRDLYVLLMRHLNPDLTSCINDSIARSRMKIACDSYNPKSHCIYHQVKSKIDNIDCTNCAKGLSEGWTNVLIDDVARFTDIVPQVSG